MMAFLDPAASSKEETPQPKKRGRKRFRKWIRKGLLALLAIYASVVLYNSFKPLPPGISVEGGIHSLDEDSVEFLYDLTYRNEAGDIVVEQRIFDRVFEMIEGAEDYVLLDMFLFDTEEDGFRDLANELVDNLIEKKKRTPDIKINVMTDPYNTRYGSIPNGPLGRLEEAGIAVSFSDMDRLRDSNFLYSGIWRMCFQVFGLPVDFSHGGLIEIEGQPCSPRSLFKALNCKANHRKVLVACSGHRSQTLVTSANPSAYGSDYSNVAMYMEETSAGIRDDVYESEKAIAAYSGEAFVERDFPEIGGDEVVSGSRQVSVQFITEGKIREALLEEFKKVGSGDEIAIGMFLVTERNVVNALVEASNRGADIKIVVDPSKYLFGQDSQGVPNRPAMSELHRKTDGKIEIRWYDTHGEEFHSKTVIVAKKEGEVVVFLGSANLTRRNIGDYNLEADVKLVAKRDSKVIREIDEYYRRIWENRDGNYTIDYEVLADDSLYRYSKYWLQERSGLCAW